MSYLDDYSEHMDFDYEYETYEDTTDIKVTFRTNRDEVMSCTIPLFKVTLTDNMEISDYTDDLIGKISNPKQTTPEVQLLLEAIYEQPFMEKMFEDETLEIVEIIDITEPTDEEVEEVQQVLRKRQILKDMVNCNYKQVAQNLIYQYGRDEMAKMLLENEEDDTDGSYLKNGKLSLVRSLVYKQINVSLRNNEVEKQLREHLEFNMSYRLEMLRQQLAKV